MEVVEQKTVVARKEHVCDYCEMPIKKGNTYERSFNTDGGDSWTWKSHMHCSKLIKELDMFDVDGIGCDEFQAAIDDYVTERCSKPMNWAEKMKKALELAGIEEDHIKPKAYLVEAEYGEGAEIVFASTRNDARLGALNLDKGYMELTARRWPEYDKYADAGKVPVSVLLEDGWWFSCEGGCGNMLWQDDIDEGRAVMVNDRPCCNDCAEE